jgi:uncharacterized membrane protein YeiH
MEILLDIINIIGIISFAAAGAMVAIDKENDLFGVVLLSLTTCFGGGMIRDMIGGQTIGRELPAVFTDMEMEIIVCILTALAVFFIAMILKEKYVKEEGKVEWINNFLDALGIGVFTSVGTGAYLSLGLFISMFMGVMSAVGGSAIRDVVLNTVPMVFRKRIYAIACMVGSAVYYVIANYFMQGMPSRDVVATLSCIAVIFVIRMCATFFKWNLPKAIDFEKEEITK